MLKTAITFASIYIHFNTLRKKEKSLRKTLWKKVKLFNSLPNDKILDWSKLKAFANDKMNVNEKFNFGLGRTKNIVGKGENAGYQHFLLFPQCFQKAFSFQVVKGQDCVVKG